MMFSKNNQTFRSKIFMIKLLGVKFWSRVFGGFYQLEALLARHFLGFDSCPHAFDSPHHLKPWVVMTSKKLLQSLFKTEKFLWLP